MLQGAIVSLIAAAACLSGAAPPRLPVAPRSACEATPAQDLLPHVVGPMRGGPPAWMIAGDEWSDPGPMKVLWVVERTTEPLRIEGRQLDGEGILQFKSEEQEQKGGLLAVSNPAKWSVFPGGASSDVMGRYAFLPSYVYYPSAGCWELTVHVGWRVMRIVQSLRPAVADRLAPR